MKNIKGYTYITAIVVYVLIGFIMVSAVWWYENHQEQKTDSIPSQAEICEQRGGNWISGSAEYGDRCILTYDDAGTPCTSSDQCQGDCVTTILDQLGVSGTCAVDNDPQGCDTPIEKEHIECLFDDIMVRCTADNWSAVCEKNAQLTRNDPRCDPWRKNPPGNIICQAEFEPGYYYNQSLNSCEYSGGGTGCESLPFETIIECENICVNNNNSEVIENSDWLTYENEDYRYSVQYPSDYAVSGESDRITLRPADNSGGSNLVVFRFTGDNNASFNEEELEWYSYARDDLYPTTLYFDRHTKTLGDEVFTAFDFDPGSTGATQYFIKDDGGVWLIHDMRSPDTNDINDQILSTFQFTATTNSLDSTDWLTYENEDLGISFEYPTSWGPIDVKYEDYTEYNNGQFYKINFTGSENNSFGTNFQVLYSTPDFSVGREIWVGEVLSKYTINELCDLGDNYEWSYGNESRYCNITTKGDKKTAEYLTRVDGLGAYETIAFLKMFVFETGHSDFPIGGLALWLPDTNQVTFVGEDGQPDTIGYSDQDLENLEIMYSNINNGNVDAMTINFLDDFNRIVDTFSYLE